MRCIHATRRRSLVASTTSGQSRRTSTSDEPAAGGGAAAGSGAGAGSAGGCSGSGSGSGRGSARRGLRRRGSGARLRRGRRGRGLGAARRPARRPARAGSATGATGCSAAAGAGSSRTGAGLGGPPAIDARFSSRSTRASRPGLGRVGPGQQHPGADQLEQQPGRGRAAHLGEAGRDQVGGAAQLGRTEPGGLGDQPLGLVLGDVDQAGGGRVGDGGDDHQVAQPPQQVLGEAAGVLAGLDDPVDHPEDGRAVAGRERVDDVVEQRGRACSRGGRWRGRG